MIPSLVDIGGPWKVLPPGVHEACLEEVEQTYATSAYRRELFEGFKAGYQNLIAAGCRNIFLDGSYVGEKLRPGDFDALWDHKGVISKMVDPILLNTSKQGRVAQKLKYKGEFFLSNFFFNYFQKDKHTGKPKGIIRVH